MVTEKPEPREKISPFRVVMRFCFSSTSWTVKVERVALFLSREVTVTSVVQASEVGQRV